jgi:peptidyl-prolyl cis-trans isomerase A (cyclophilin A)
LGADRFVQLVQEGFFNDIALFRCVKDFIVQFGINEDKAVQQRYKNILDDHPETSIPFKQGMLSFAGGGKDTRDTSMFIAFTDSTHLGKVIFALPL